MPASVRASSRPPYGLELNLLFDCSGSMYTSAHHAATQLRGHIDAFAQDDIMEALIANRTVVRCVLWNTTARLIGTPIAITSRESVIELCNLLRTQVPIVDSPGFGTAGTSHDVAVGFALELPRLASRCVIDVSTDEGVGLINIIWSEIYKKEAEHAGIQINAIIVGGSKDEEQSLVNFVCTRDGSLTTVEQWDQYADGLRKKLITEIALR